jgi:acetyl-CoA C-acetyltransferase
VNLAAAQIMSGMEDLVIAGGTEMMSYHGQIADPSQPPMIDSGNLELRAMHPAVTAGCLCLTAIATLEGIDRDAVDDLALVSQARAAQAIAEGRFDKSLITVKNPDGTGRTRSRGIPPTRNHQRRSVRTEDGLQCGAGRTGR